MDPVFINKETIASLLPMTECISVMEKTFRSLASGNCVQPLRPLMWLPDKKGLLGMMPGYAGDIDVMGIKVISVFPGNKNSGYSSHQGVVVLFETKNGRPICIADADEITAIRTPAASAVATNLLAKKDAETLSILGSGLQAARHIEAMLLVRKIKKIILWSRNELHAKELAEKIVAKVDISIAKNPEEAVRDIDIICTVTGSADPLIKGEWVSKGTHINAVGACTSTARELDTVTILKSKLFTDSYESLYHEAGDFIIPKNEGAIDNSHVKGEIGEILLEKKNGRTGNDDITVFKSLGLAVEDIFSVDHIYRKLTGKLNDERNG
jgi:ornithine cyclodeaminase/alanine dehydrogenase-like protein (mu-crystallin family)